VDELERIEGRKIRIMIEAAQRRQRDQAGTVAIATDENLDSLTRRADFCVVDFWAEWCGPCRAMAPIIEELSREYAGKALFCKLNVDEDPLTAQKFGIMSIPTLLFVKTGEVVDILVGVVPKRTIQERLAKYLHR